MSKIWRVPQRVIGYPNGECVRASYASLLRIPIDEVPRFDPASIRARGRPLISFGPPDSTHSQRLVERRWLNSLGLDLIVIPAEERPSIHPDRYHLMSTMANSPQGPLGHRVVGRGGNVEWDPHPGGMDIYSVVSFLFVVGEDGRPIP